MSVRTLKLGLLVLTTLVLNGYSHGLDFDPEIVQETANLISILKKSRVTIHNTDVRNFTTVYTSIGGKISELISLPLTEKLVECHVQLPGGVLFQLWPSYNSSDDRVTLAPGVLTKECGVNVRDFSLELGGDWNIVATHNTSKYGLENVVKSIRVLILETVDTIPPTSLDVYEGQDITMKMQKFHHEDDCEVRMPTAKAMRQGNYERLVSGDFCGVLIKNVSMDCNGIWKFKSDGKIVYNSNLKLTVRAMPKVETKKTIRTGRKEVLNFGPKESLFCEATDPSGVRYPHQLGQCSLVLPKVSMRHNGQWNVQLGLPGTTEVFSYVYDVAVEEGSHATTDEVVVSATLAENRSSLQIVCSLVMVSPAKSCRMTRSDGKSFVLSEGVGSGRYTYYGNGTKQNKYGEAVFDCGISIHNPDNVDLNSWHCYIVHGEDNIEVGGVIPVSEIVNITVDKQNMTAPQTTFVETHLNSAFEMKCSQPSPIEYCWFQAPNRTHFSVIPGAPREEFEYVGKGLGSGECGIRIFRTSAFDEGVWKCNLGGSNDVDIQTKIKVKVYQSTLVPYQKNFVLERGTLLGCRTYDNSSLEYCRFVRPDGVGISPTGYSTGYSSDNTNLTEGQCFLRLNSPSTLDYGIWRCAAKGYGSNVEYQDTMNIYSMWYWVETSASSAMILTILYMMLFTGVVTVVTIGIMKTSKNAAVRSRARMIRDSFRFNKATQNAAANATNASTNAAA